MMVRIVGIIPMDEAIKTIIQVVVVIAVYRVVSEHFLARRVSIIKRMKLKR